MQIFLITYMVISLCEIFTVGWFPLDGAVRRGFSAVHIASITAGSWILMMNGAVGFQLLDDGTPLSLGLIFGSAAALFVGTGYIALDTGFSFTGYWDDTLIQPNKAYALYTLYQLVPLVFIVVFFVLEAVLVLRVLGERRPMRKQQSTSNQSLSSRTDTIQSTSSLQRYYSRSDKSSNTSSVNTSAPARTERSMAHSSRYCLHYYR